MAEFGPTFSIVASFQYKGQLKNEIPQNVILGYQLYVFEGSRPRYRDFFNLSEEFIILADGERLFGTMQRTELHDNVGGKYGVMSTPLPLETLSKMANSKKVEMRVGNREFELKEHHLQALRDLIARAKA